MALKEKTTLEIDVTRLNKAKFRSFTRADGSVATVATVDFIELDTQEVALNADKQPISGGGRTLNKVGFVTESPTKEEREAQTQTPVLGDAKRWLPDGETAPAPAPVETGGASQDEIKAEDIPF